MKLVLERPHEQYGNAIFTKLGMIVLSSAMTDVDNIEILTIELKANTLTFKI
jgi:hypothetical protein